MGGQAQTRESPQVPSSSTEAWKGFKYVKDVIGVTALPEKFERVKKKAQESFENKFD